MSSINDMLESFKDLAETKAFINQQHVTIMQLHKKIQKLEEEKKHLESLIQQTTPMLVESNNQIASYSNIINEHEETICRMELKRLHDISVERMLTYEETKKVDIFTKLLLQINAKPRTIELEAKNKNTTELLALVENDNESK